MAPHSTPLLLLLDGVLSNDEERVKTAMEQIRSLIGSRGGALRTSDPNQLSETSLLATVEQLMIYCPEMSGYTSQHDGSLPLHFAASLGKVDLVRILFQHVRADIG